MTKQTSTLSQNDKVYLDRAVHLALGAEKQGNLPIGALITLGDIVVAEAANAVFVPAFRPGRYAELQTRGRQICKIFITDKISLIFNLWRYNVVKALERYPDCR